MELTLLLLLASSVHGAVIEKRQQQSPSALSSFLSSLIPQPAKLAKVQDIKPRIRTTAKRQQALYGPIDLPASTAGEGGHKKGGMAMDPDGIPFTRSINGGFCTDCTVLAAQIDLVHANGTRADISSGVYLHHMIMGLMGGAKQPSEPAWVSMCPGNSSILSKVDGPAMGGFAGAAVDEFVDYFTDIKGKTNSGYYIPAKSNAIMTGEVINYIRSPQQVYLQLDIEWVPGKVGANALKTPLNVEGCDFTHSTFKKVTGKGKIVSEKYTVKRSGVVICGRAHMHDGGVGVAAFVNGKMVCNSQATYGLEGGRAVVDGKEWKTISKMSECLDPIYMKKGDVITLEASYDHETHPLRVSHGEMQGNMGFMTLTFVPQ